MKETKDQPEPLKPLEEEEQAWAANSKPIYTADELTQDDSLIGRFAYSTDRDTVERYLDLNQRFARWMGAGVGLIICVVIPTILYDNDFGVAIMMILIAAGIGILIKHALEYQEIEKMEKKNFHLSGELICDLQEDYQRFQKTFARKIVLGVSLIFVGVGVMLIFNGLFGEYDAHAAFMFPL